MLSQLGLSQVEIVTVGIVLVMNSGSQLSQLGLLQLGLSQLGFRIANVVAVGIFPG